MFGYKTAMLGTILSASLATTAFAQDSGTATMSAADCETQFGTFDADTNGFLSEAEAPREHARSRVDAVTLQDTGLSKEEFLSQCGTEHWVQNVPEEGAPLEGANSFTEEQARDRAVSWNVTETSALVLDTKGIWRGVGKLDGADVSVAVDYKGNVVTTPKL